MPAVSTADIRANPNEVVVVLTAEDGPHELRFPAAGAAQFARDMSQAASRALQLSRSSQSEREQGVEQLFAPRATLEDYGLDSVSGDVILRLRDEEGVLHVFRVAPTQINEFAHSAI